MESPSLFIKTKDQSCAEVSVLQSFKLCRHRRHDWGDGELVAGAVDYVSIRWTGIQKAKQHLAPLAFFGFELLTFHRLARVPANCTVYT